MVKNKDLERIIKAVARDFSFLKGKVLGILLFGSASEGTRGEKSDIDICIVAPRKKPGEILREVFRRVDVFGKKYDVYIFEELPLYLKIEVVRKHTVVFGNPYELGEYFYTFIKIWENQKHRQKLSKKEMMKILRG